MGSTSMNTFSTIFRHTSALSLAVGIIAGTSAIAFAQTVPTAVDPANLEKRFDQPKAATPRSEAPVAEPQQQLSPKVQAELSKKQFTLKKVEIEGNTVYSDADLQSTYAGMVGQRISLLDANGIAQKITNRYRDNGYLLSQAIIPSQDVGSGTLKIRVVEGYISNVVIQGAVEEGRGRELVEAYGKKITAKRPVNLEDLERYMLLMDDLPGATAKGVVRPSTKTPGSAELVVTMEQKDYEGSYTADNRGSKPVGPWQHTGILVGNSLFSMYDRTLFRFITTSPTNELKFYDLQHEQQLGSEGTRLVLDASYSHSKPRDFVSATRIVSDSYFFQAKVVHPVIRSRQENFNVRGIFDFRNTDTDVFTNVDFTKDRLRVARAGAAYDFADALLGVNLIDAQVSQGLGIFGASDQGDAVSNSVADGTFTKLNLDVSRTQILPSDFSLFLSASGQYAFQPLLAAEQFTVGGAGFGYAYDPAELAGDHGAAGKVELRYGQPSEGPYLSNYQLYGFYDLGKVWSREAGPGADKSLSSAGGGVRTNFSNVVSADLQVAVPLTKDVSNQGGHGDDPRYFLSVTGRF